MASYKENYIVDTIDKAQSQLGNSNPGVNLFNYVKNELGAETFVSENKYTDKDFLIDYSKFYARSFDCDDRFTKRVHFFKTKFDIDKFNQILLDGNSFILDPENYLGFIVVKPIRNQNGECLIGRTLLKPIDYGNEQNHFLTTTHHPSLFGISLSIKSLPFQAQDRAVGACATTALWTSLSPLNELFGIKKYSPYEVTEKSVSLPGTHRNFPSEGLNFLQMKSYFNLIGLETESINIQNVRHNDQLVEDAIKAYIGAGFPIIATLIIDKDNRHAVVISGYQNENGIVNRLYVHDDQIGPYSQVMPEGSFISWKNDWTEKRGYNSVILETLLVPIYPKIRLTFSRIYHELLEDRKRISEHTENKFNTDLILVQNKDYKKFLFTQSFEDKINILAAPFPRFLWIIRTHRNGIALTDKIYDGTSVFPNGYRRIRFKVVE